MALLLVSIGFDPRVEAHTNEGENPGLPNQLNQFQPLLPGCQSDCSGNVVYKPNLPSEEGPIKLPTKTVFRAGSFPKTAPVSFKDGSYGGQCVSFAKAFIGVGGTWGDGGRDLELNSGPVIGAVVIFTYTHVAVIVADNGLAITIKESNMDLNGTVSTRTILKSDPTILGYHKF